MTEIKPFKHQFILLYDPISNKGNSLGSYSNVKVTKTKCDCICHKVEGILHKDTCCNNGYIWEVEIEPKLPDDMEKSGAIIHTIFHRGIHIDPL